MAKSLMNTNFMKKLLALSLALATIAPLAHTMKNHAMKNNNNNINNKKRKRDEQLTPQSSSSAFATTSTINVSAATEQKKDICCICLDNFDISAAVNTAVCIHKFHNECLNTWKKTHDTCPLCRKTLPTLIDATMAQDIVAVKTLLATPDINVNTPAMIHGLTALHIATETNQREIVGILLAARGINVDAQTHQKETPLHIAAKKGNLEIVKKLLAHGADLTLPCNGQTAAQIAHNNGKTEIAHYLEGCTAMKKITAIKEIALIELAATEFADIECEAAETLMALTRQNHL